MEFSLRRHLTLKSSEELSDDRLMQDFEASVEVGFLIATQRGPLCAELMEGLAYFVQSITYDRETVEGESCNVLFNQLNDFLMRCSCSA